LEKKVINSIEFGLRNKGFQDAGWDSIHLLSIKRLEGHQLQYKLTSSIIAGFEIKEHPVYGKIDLGGTLSFKVKIEKQFVI
jgi:hypothetical protein